MKKVILLLAISSLLTTLLFAQVDPGGMNYQAVARNLKGEILANQPISLTVSLFSVQSSGKVQYYKEVHNVTTSLTGVFSLIVGNGTPSTTLAYQAIPWSSQNIWMEVAIKSKGDAAYLVTSSSKLLAVPYAYHAYNSRAAFRVRIAIMLQRPGNTHPVMQLGYRVIVPVILQQINLVQQILLI